METNRPLLTYLAVTSKEQFDGLETDVRDQFLTISNEEVIAANTKATDLNEAARQNMIAAGSVVGELTLEQRRVWFAYLILPVGPSLLAFRTTQAIVDIIKGRRELIIAGHEAEDLVTENKDVLKGGA